MNGDHPQSGFRFDAPREDDPTALHDTPVAEEVWELCDWLLGRCGTCRPPTLIERDEHVPGFDEMLVERERAAGMMAWKRPSFAGD